MLKVYEKIKYISDYFIVNSNNKSKNFYIPIIIDINWLNNKTCRIKNGLYAY